MIGCNSQEQRTSRNKLTRLRGRLLTEEGGKKGSVTVAQKQKVCANRWNIQQPLMTSFSKALFKTNTHTCEQHKHDGLLTQQISPQSCPVCSSYFNNLWVCVCDRTGFRRTCCCLALCKWKRQGGLYGSKALHLYGRISERIRAVNK